MERIPNLIMTVVVGALVGVYPTAANAGDSDEFNFHEVGECAFSEPGSATTKYDSKAALQSSGKPTILAATAQPAEDGVFPLLVFINDGTISPYNEKGLRRFAHQGYSVASVKAEDAVCAIDRLLKEANKFSIDEKSGVGVIGTGSTGLLAQMLALSHSTSGSGGGEDACVARVSQRIGAAASFYSSAATEQAALIDDPRNIAPILLVHHNADKVVSIDQSKAMAAALAGKGVEHYFLSLTSSKIDPAHGFDPTDNGLAYRPAVCTTLDFFKQALRDKGEDDSTDENGSASNRAAKKAASGSDSGETSTVDPSAADSIMGKEWAFTSEVASRSRKSAVANLDSMINGLDNPSLPGASYNEAALLATPLLADMAGGGLLSCKEVYFPKRPVPTQKQKRRNEIHFLLQRTGYGISPDERERYFHGMRYVDVVSSLLFYERKKPFTATPIWTAPNDDPRSDVYAKAFQRHGAAIRAWWFQEMIDTQSPLTERLTLFWHNHFTSDYRKTRHHPDMMMKQNQLFRAKALGSFKELLHAVAKDYSMMKYLDAVSSKKSAPNENFARELLELFTLGEGHYTETDVREAARAFTGWRLDKDGKYVFDEKTFDSGPKTFLGKSGNFTGEDILDILLKTDRTAEFIVEKFWREFISPEPDPAEVRVMAARFRNSDYDVRTLMRVLLLSKSFRDEKARAKLVKSPVDLIVGTVRTYGIPSDPDFLTTQASLMGQTLFMPPNVKGWPGYKHWISTDTMLKRRKLLLGFLREDVMQNKKQDKKEELEALFMAPQYQLR